MLVKMSEHYSVFDIGTVHALKTIPQEAVLIRK
jgi:hypothetical protein